jgi:Ca-activated chloride channel homolog
MDILRFCCCCCCCFPPPLDDKTDVPPPKINHPPAPPQPSSTVQHQHDEVTAVDTPPAPPQTVNMFVPTAPANMYLPASAAQSEHEQEVDLTQVSNPAPDASATISAAKEATAGSTISVQWTGPDNNGDFIGICPAGSTVYGNYAYTSEGSPASLRMPTKAGAYEIKYFAGQDNSVITSALITVTSAKASLKGPNEARAGSTVSIDWNGPDHSGDFIGICPAGSTVYGNYAYTSEGSPASLRMPTKAGAYEIKYFAGQDNSVITSALITVTSAKASLKGPNEARARSTVSIDWNGPDDSGDFIGICPAGSTVYGNYAYTSEGSPASLRMPTKAGIYEISYFVGQDNNVIASIRVSVAAAEAKLNAPVEANAGSIVSVSWSGPNDSGDFLGICAVGSMAYISYTYTSEGSPASLLIPAETGAFEIKYFVGQDETVLATARISVA